MVIYLFLLFHASFSFFLSVMHHMNALSKVSSREATIYFTPVILYFADVVHII